MFLVLYSLPGDVRSAQPVSVINPINFARVPLSAHSYLLATFSPPTLTLLVSQFSLPMLYSGMSGISLPHCKALLLRCLNSSQWA